MSQITRTIYRTSIWMFKTWFNYFIQLCVKQKLKRYNHDFCEILRERHYITGLIPVTLWFQSSSFHSAHVLWPLRPFVPSYPWQTFPQEGAICFQIVLSTYEGKSIGNLKHHWLCASSWIPRALAKPLCKGPQDAVDQMEQVCQAVGIIKKTDE